VHVEHERFLINMRHHSAPLGDVSSTPGSLDGEEGRGRYLEQAGEEPPPTRSFSPWSDDSSSDTPLNSQPEQIHSASELQDNMEAVEAMLNQLARIAVAVRRSGRRSRLQKADQRFIPEEHEDLESHLVTILLARPGCSKEQLDPRQLSDVQRRLIRCNLKRRNRFLYAQEHSIRLAPAISGEHATEKARLQQPTSDVLARGALKPLTVDATPWEAAGISANPTLRTGTSASAVSDSLTLPQDMAPAPAASTIMSSTVIDLKYPRPPKIEKGALIFPCPCCCETLPVAFSDINKWK
jgi:hypothetical protein